MKIKCSKINDKRISKKFAWFPVEIEPGLKVWLESYYVTETYESYGGNSPTWRDYNRYTKEQFEICYDLHIEDIYKKDPASVAPRRKATTDKV